MQRYESYKDSGIEWIGEIPEGWMIAPVKRCVEISNGSDPTTTGETPVYGSGGTSFKTCGESKEGPAVLLGRKGTIDMPQWVDGLYWNVDTAFDVKAVPNCMNLRFYFYLAQCFDYLKYRTQTAVPSMAQSDYREMRIPRPDLRVQNAIADFLDAKTAEIDSLIADAEKSVELLEEYRTSIISEAVTKGLDPNASMKDSGIEWIGEIPEGWKNPKLLFCLKSAITDGPHETPDFFEEGIPFISAEAVSCGNGRIDFEHMRGFVSEEYYEKCCEKYIPQVGDIYMIKSGATTGRVSIVDTDRKFTIWSPLAAIRCDCDVLRPAYAFYFLQSEGFQKQVENAWTYGTQQNIGMRELEQLKVCLPTLVEQEEIVSFLDGELEALNSLVQEKLVYCDKLREYRKSLIYEAVTGKIKVPGVE